MNDNPDLRLQLLRLAVEYLGRDNTGDPTDVTECADAFLNFINATPAIN